jgi:hypothetical protein
MFGGFKYDSKIFARSYSLPCYPFGEFVGGIGSLSGGQPPDYLHLSG